MCYQIQRIMKNTMTFLALLLSCILHAQAYTGKGDIKGQVGTNIQRGGSGIAASADFGIGDNMSYGFSSSYMLNATEGSAKDVSFNDRFDCKARFNANIGNVFNMDKKMDIYPGLDLGFKNFGAHLGFRYFFTSGFGLYSEAGIPLAKYNNHDIEYNNQFVFYFGASFNL